MPLFRFVVLQQNSAVAFQQRLAFKFVPSQF